MQISPEKFIFNINKLPQVTLFYGNNILLHNFFKNKIKLLYKNKIKSIEESEFNIHNVQFSLFSKEKILLIEEVKENFKNKIFHSKTIIFSSHIKYKSAFATFFEKHSEYVCIPCFNAFPKNIEKIIHHEIPLLKMPLDKYGVNLENVLSYKEKTSLLGKIFIENNNVKDSCIFSLINKMLFITKISLLFKSGDKSILRNNYLRKNDKDILNTLNLYSLKQIGSMYYDMLLIKQHVISGNLEEGKNALQNYASIFKNKLN